MTKLTKAQARAVWLCAQRLDTRKPFGKGPEATRRAVEHLGYVQIDTINVIERCHHHILFSRIPEYRRSDLHRAQSHDKSVFEYWTHALAYVPTKDFRYFMRDMRRYAKDPGRFLGRVQKGEMDKVLKRIRREGAISIRDITDDVLVEKTHEWASKKPSKRALQLGFYSGKLTISERVGMLKKYELAGRHFDWIEKPKAASDAQILEYQLDRALRAQGVVSLDSICHLAPSRKPKMRKLIEARVKRNELRPVQIQGAELVEHWLAPQTLDEPIGLQEELTHILSPFDPLIIQRKRLKMFFDYEHRFEAYLPKEKRAFGYFALPILIGDRVVALVDLKTDRVQKKLILQKMTSLSKSTHRKDLIESALGTFERFQLEI